MITDRLERANPAHRVDVSSFRASSHNRILSLWSFDIFGSQTIQLLAVLRVPLPFVTSSGENRGETTGTHPPYPKTPPITAAQPNGNPFRSQPSHRYPGSHGDTAASAAGVACGNVLDASCAEEPIPIDLGAARIMRSSGSSTAAVASPSPAPAASGTSGSGENADFSAPGGSSATSFCSSPVMMPRAPKVKWKGTDLSCVFNVHLAR